MRKFICCLATLVAVASCFSVIAANSQPSGKESREKVMHLLNRITYGPSPADIAAVEAIGIEQYIQRQLNPESLPLPPEVERMARKDTLAESPAKLFLRYGPPAIQRVKNGSGRSGEAVQGRVNTANFERPSFIIDGPAAGQRRSTREPEFQAGNADMQMAENTGASERLAQGLGGRQSLEQGKNRTAKAAEGQKLLQEIHKKFYGDLVSARMTRAVYSPRQLDELMVDFWFNHFNVSVDKGLDHLLTGTYEEHAIRPHVMGKFRDLLGATAHHAAMSFYLDNWQNTAPDSPGARGKLQGLNENYARELLELHTLGVDGGYTQKDVVELARVLTGFGFQQNARLLSSGAMLDSQSGTRFNAARHDFKDKLLLKHHIRPTGEGELEEALDLLARHPSTAYHICYKLAGYFVADVPPPSLVKKMAAKFTASDGDIRSVLNEMFHSFEFWDPRYYSCKFKTPYQYLISSLRATDARLTAVPPLINFLQQSGMPLYRCVTPDGYKTTKSAWLNPDAMIKRINLATSIGVGRYPGAQPGYYDYRQALPLLGTAVSKRTREAIESAPQPLRLALVLGSPEFMMH